jgi:hypothetical protein
VGTSTQLVARGRLLLAIRVFTIRGRLFSVATRDFPFAIRRVTFGRRFSRAQSELCYLLETLFFEVAKSQAVVGGRVPLRSPCSNKGQAFAPAWQVRSPHLIL